MNAPSSKDVVTKFTWKIANFSSLKETWLYSDTFLVGTHKARILLLPKGRDGYLSAYLDFSDSEKMFKPWSVAADFSLTVVNQTNRLNSVKCGCIHNFKNEPTVKPVRECNFYIPIRECSPRGFLVKDTIIIEAQACINLATKLYVDLKTLETELRKEATAQVTRSSIFVHATMLHISQSVPKTKEELMEIKGIRKGNFGKIWDRVLQTIEATIRDYHKKYGSDNRDNGIDNCLSPESQQQGDQQVIEPEMVDQSHGHSASPSLPSKVARTTTITSPSCLSVQLTSKNLIAELSTMARSWNSQSVDGINLSSNVANDGPALLQQQREKLAKFFEMPVNEICKANRFDNVQEVVLKTHELATDPSEKSVLKDLMSRLVEFRNTTPESVSIFESSREVETSAAQKMKELKGSLLQRQKQLTFLDSEDSRIAEEQMKVEAEIQLLVLLRDKLGNEKKTTEAEMEVANREVSRELEELKSKQTEHSQAKGSRLRAKERLAQDNVSWILFKEKLGL